MPTRPWLAVKSLNAASSLVWHELPLQGNSAHRFEQPNHRSGAVSGAELESRRQRRTGNPVYERPIVLVIYREDHRFLLDPIIPEAGRHHRQLRSGHRLAAVSCESFARFQGQTRDRAGWRKRSGPAARLIGIHSHGHDPAWKSSRKSGRATIRSFMTGIRSSKR